MGTDGMSTNDVGIDTVITIGFRGQDLPLDVETGVIPNSPLLNFSDSPFVDDDSWAEPPRAADRRLRIAAIVLGLGVVAIAFFILGARIAKSRVVTPVAGAFGGRAAGGFGGAGLGFGGRSRAAQPTIGKVTKVDGNTVTMTNTDGTTVIVNLAEDTSIGRRKTQPAKNIKIGDEISVRGVTGDDGAIAATAATVGDIEPSANPAGALGLGSGVGNGVLGGSAALSSQVLAGQGGSEPAASGSVSATTVPSLGGLLPG
jgi:hypothetical protein